MAGCFGNSPYDRSMEQQLFNHLDKEAEWDTFCDKVIDCISEELWDSGLDTFFDKEEAQKALNDGCKDNLPFEEIASKIEGLYMDYLISQDPTGKM